MPLGWQDRVVARVAGRCLGTAVNPSFQIIEGIDDPTAELPVGRPRAIGSVLFQGSSGQTDLPPLKWSSLKYGFAVEDRIDGKEEAYS